MFYAGMYEIRINTDGLHEHQNNGREQAEIYLGWTVDTSCEVHFTSDLDVQHPLIVDCIATFSMDWPQNADSTARLAGRRKVPGLLQSTAVLSLNGSL